MRREGIRKLLFIGLLALLAWVVALATLVLTAWVFSEDADAREADRRTTYATCYQLQGRMANGQYVHKRAAASNHLRLGTKIRITSKATGPGGIRKYIISDTGGSPLNDGHLDLWAPSCYGWPNPRITYKFGWSKR